MITDPDLIAFAGDWHGNGLWGAQMIEKAAAQGAQAIVHTGDFGFTFNRTFMEHIRHALHDFNMWLLFVDGNHDEHPQLFAWPKDVDGFGTPPFGGRGAERLKYIPRGHRWSWWGKTFLGVGGASSVDRPWRTPYVDWWPEEMITTGDVYKAIAGGPADVMVCHDVFERAGLPFSGNPGGWSEGELIRSQENRLMLEQIVDVAKPELFVHGHFHRRYGKMVGGCRVIGLDMDGTTPQSNLYFVDAMLTEYNYLPRREDDPPIGSV